MITYFIVPVYNTEKYLQRCIDSIFAQTDKDFFVIFINDGSTDGSLSILEEEKKKHNNLVIINKENGGLSSARNAGLKYIKDFDNCYISFVDSDDFIDKEFIEKSKNAMNKYNADIVCSLYKGLNEDGTYCSNIFLTGDDLVLDRFSALKLLVSGNIKCHAPTKLYKGKLWENTYFDESISFLEDQYLTPCIFNKAKTSVKLFYYSYFYQHHAGSLCQSKMTPNKIIDSLNSYVFLYNFSFDLAFKENKKLNRKILNEFYKIYLMMYPRIDKKEFSQLQLDQINKIILFAKKHKILFNLHPSSLKEFIKKSVFVFSKKLYCRLYKRYIKEY
ncbi:MAG: glycosyltransferase [Bacteroidales bacterium]|nr:glycosyltransferase [Bacteroidales bacterium]